MSVQVYIKPEKHTQVYDKKVNLGQVAQVYCRDKTLEAKCKQLRILTITDSREHLYVLSVMELIEKIQENHPHVDVTNLGEADVIIGYQPHPPGGGWKQWIKTGIVCGIVFFGGAFAIMTFNNDGSVSQIFQDVDRLIMGQKESDDPQRNDQEIPSTTLQEDSPTKTLGILVLEISYSVGLVLGVTVFFNHIGKRKMTLDPTPIEVQMRLYEDQVGTTVIQNASRKE